MATQGTDKTAIIRGNIIKPYYFLIMSFSKFTNRAWEAALASFLALAIVMVAYFAVEPSISRSATDQFLVTQTVTGALAFETDIATVAMVGTLNGLTGGTSYATATTRITTNNVTGYNMTIQFSSTTAMKRNGSNHVIDNYVYSSSTTAYPSGYDTSQVYSQFGFSVNASNTAEVSDVFTHTGGTCGTGNNSTFTVNNCWRGASSTDETFETELISTSAPTPASGSTSTVQFRITIPNGPSPAVPDGTYTATATLTALDN